MIGSYAVHAIDIMNAFEKRMGFQLNLQTVILTAPGSVFPAVKRS